MSVNVGQRGAARGNFVFEHVQAAGKNKIDTNSSGLCEGCLWVMDTWTTGGDVLTASPVHSVCVRGMYTGVLGITGREKVAA